MTAGARTSRGGANGGSTSAERACGAFLVTDRSDGGICLSQLVRLEPWAIAWNLGSRLVSDPYGSYL